MRVTRLCLGNEERPLFLLLHRDSGQSTRVELDLPTSVESGDGASSQSRLRTKTFRYITGRCVRQLGVRVICSIGVPPTMQTPMITTTHIVTNALVARRWAKSIRSPKAFIAGGLAPDVGLLLMTAGAAVVLPRTRGMSVSEALHYSFDELFFNSKPWIAAANVLHSPVVVAALFLVSAAVPGIASDRLRSFAQGAALHIAMDIPVHVDDGPVLFWPLNWSYRFTSRFSYYDDAYYGQWIAPVDIAITLVGAAFLLRQYLAQRGLTS